MSRRSSVKADHRTARGRLGSIAPTGAALAVTINHAEFERGNLIGGFVFGSIGFVAFIYGKRMNLWKPMFLGIGLMIYPYFVSNDAVMIAIGAIGTAGLFFLR